jgi:DDE superfamily endonuclease
LPYEAMTGLTGGQLTELAARAAAVTGGIVRPGGRAAAIGLYRSVAMVVTLMRANITQERAGQVFGVSQATVSRRWDLLRPVIGQILARDIPRPAQILGGSTALADGTVAPTWDWAAVPDLYCGKSGYPGMNLQIAATLQGRVAAIGPVPVHGARRDAHAFAASGLKDLLDGHPVLADLGYLGVDGISIVPYRKPRRGQLSDEEAAISKHLSKIRAAVERAIASIKTWRMLSEEGGRYRCPISTYPQMLTAITGLYFFSHYWNDL